MQVPDPISSQTWADKIYWMLGGGGLLTAIVALIKVILNRNKPKTDNAKTDAETESTQANTAIKLSSHLLILHNRMNFLESSLDKHQTETASTIRYYREQLEYFEKLTRTHQNRSHALNGELGRLVLAITNLQTDFAEKTGQRAEAVEIRTYDQIVEPYPLPHPPSS